MQTPKHFTAITTHRVNHELYVFRGGQLIYKRWINTHMPFGQKPKHGQYVPHRSYGRVFHENEGLTQFAK